MPIDKTVIKTRLRIQPELFSDPNLFILKHDLEIRTAKPTPGTLRGKPTLNLKLDVLNYKGIKLELRKVRSKHLTDVVIHFNPGVCLYSHNGSILTLAEFLDALSVLVAQTKALLENPNEWFDLLPGLRKGSPAYWHLIELPFQCLDVDGSKLAGFRHLSHPNMRTPARHWPNSISLGGKRGKLQISIYRKALEMVAHEKIGVGELPDYADVLRIETRMKDEKLLHYIGNDRNVEMIDGTMRLVRFYPVDLIGGHRQCLSELRGVYSSNEPLQDLSARGQLVPLGRLLAHIVLDQRTTQMFPELLAHIRFYTGASSDTMKELRTAGLAVLKSHSTIARDVIFSDTAYETQHGVAAVTCEGKVFHEFNDTLVHRTICNAYRPPDQPFRPLTQWPDYLRY